MLSINIKTNSEKSLIGGGELIRNTSSTSTELLKPPLTLTGSGEVVGVKSSRHHGLFLFTVHPNGLTVVISALFISVKDKSE